MGQLPEALRCHNRALALKPDVPQVLCAKGTTLIYLNQADEALACFQRAETVSPGMKDALAGIGWALRSLGRFEEADQYLHKLRAADPVDPKSYAHVSSEGKGLDADEEQRLAVVVDRRDISADARITAGLALDGCWTGLGGMTKRSPGMQPRMLWSVRSGPRRRMISSTQTASRRGLRG